MDVTCNRCGTIYEFEEGLISTTGTTVKCTQCGHLFKVHRPTASGSAPEDSSDSHSLRWRIRRVDGSTHTLESLTELTPLIGAGQFTRDDEISRTGQVWKKLGDIQELASIFEQAPRSRRTGEMSLQPPPPPLPPPPPPGSASKVEEGLAGASAGAGEPSAPTRARRSTSERFHVMGTEVGLEGTPATPAPSRTKPPAPPPPPSAPAPATAAETEEADSDSAQTLNRAPAPAARGDEELPQPRTRTSRLWPWLLAVGIPLALAAGIGRTLVERERPRPPADPARSFLQRGEEALASHLPERFDEAVSEYTKALAYHRDDAHILSSISRVYAVWAQWLRTRARWLRAAAGSGAELEAVEREASQLADQAKLYGERAAQRNPGNEEASVALSDALRLSGNLVAARSELDRARATEGVAAAETLRVAALLSIDEANGELRSGRSLAEQAVARDPALLRARLLLAECLAQDGDFAGAHMHLDAARARGKHAIIDQTRTEIDRTRQAARAAEPSAEARSPLPPAAPAQAASAPAPRSAPQAKPAEPPADPPAAPKPRQATAQTQERAGENALDLTSKGETALERGQVRGAQRLFEQALELEPGMPRARTGLGYVALERSQPRQAINHFRPAARGGNPEALIGLGDAYRRLGRAKEALAAYREYLERYPRGERSSIAQRQVELLTEQLEDNP